MPAPTKKNFNPTAAVLFVDERFGKGSLVSAPIDEKNYDAIMKNVQVGTKLLVKLTTFKTGKAGGYLEVLPALNKKTYTKKASTTANTDI